jgi:iron complex transport system permease protein
MSRLNPAVALPVLTALGAVAILASVLSGSVAVPWLDAARALGAGGDPMVRTVLLDLRLPRALLGFAVGGMLALAGALLQVLLRNPLADPYVLGVSGGASVGALLAIMAGLSAVAIDSAAAMGAMVATLTVFALAHGNGGWTPTRLLLTGVVVAAGTSAAVTLLLALSDDQGLRGMLFWLMGDLSRPERWPWLLGALVAATVTGATLGRHLDVLARGEAQAAVLGMRVRSFQIGLFLASAGLTGLATSAAGSIGFVGLVTPHLVRLALGSGHRLLLPASALLGGTLLTLADLLSRVVAAPRQLPVGALTALVGVPVFLALMARQQRR